MPFEPSSFGRYVLLKRIAIGGMAEVFLARTVGEGGFEKLVAIKRVLPHLALRESFTQMFIDEARISATLTLKSTAIRCPVICWAARVKVLLQCS